MSSTFMSCAVNQFPFFLIVRESEAMIWECREEKLEVGKCLLPGELHRGAFCDEVVRQQRLQIRQIPTFEEVGEFCYDFKVAHDYSPFKFRR